MKLNLKINSMLLCLALFAACSSDDDGQVAQDSSQEQKQPQKTYPLSIEVAENPMVQEGEGGSSRRAPITTGSSLTSFKLDYVYGPSKSTNGEGHAYNVTNTSGTWTTTGSWPIVDEDTNVDWYAYTGGTFLQTDDSDKFPYISFHIDEFAEKQHDLLVATTNGTHASTYDAKTETCKFSFTFNHVCSALRFKVKKAKTLTASLSIGSVKLCHISTQENYFFNTGSWSASGSKYTDYTLFSPKSPVELTSTTDYVTLNGSEDDSYLFLIPQVLVGNVSTGTYIEINWTCSAVSPGSGTAKIPFSYTLQKGTKHDVKINLGATTLTNYSGS